LPATIGGLAAAPYNPRKIGESALAGLAYSLEQFGDISGVVWNTRTSHLVAGHQRVKALAQKFGDLAIADGSICLPGGLTFPVRVVDWSLEQEKAANVAANSPTISGEFTEDLPALLAEIEASMPDAWSGMGFGELLAEVSPVKPPSGQPPPPTADNPKPCRCPECGCEFVP